MAERLRRRSRILNAPCDNDTQNGLIIPGGVVSEEIFTTILSYVPADKLLHLSLVCKSWCRLIRTSRLWMIIYERSYKKKTIEYPWYLFYAVFTGRLNHSLLKNCDFRRHIEHYHCIPKGDDLEYDPYTVGAIGCYLCPTEKPLGSGINERENLNSASDKLLFWIINEHKLIVHLRMRFHNDDISKLNNVLLRNSGHCNDCDKDCRFGRWAEIDVHFEQYSVKVLEEFLLHSKKGPWN